MDHGPMLASRSILIEASDTTETLTPKLASSGAKLLLETLPAFFDGLIKPVEQDHTQATFVKLLTREDGHLHPETQTAQVLEHLIRANIPWPGSFIEVHGKRIKILQSKLDGSTDALAGSRYQVNGIPALACADGTGLLLLRVQPEGKPPLEGAAFLRGSRDWLSD